MIINKKKSLMGFLQCFICVLLAYGVYLYPHYSQDVYSKMVRLGDFEAISLQWAIESGRYTYAIINRIVLLTLNTPIINSFTSNLICLFEMTVVIYFFYYLISGKKDLPDSFFNYDMALFISSVCIFINPLFCDWFQFPECVYIYIIGIILVEFSIWELFIKQQLIYALLFFLLAIGCYQPCIGYFVMLSIIMSLKHSVNCENNIIKVNFIMLFKNAIKAVGIYGIGCFSQVIITSFSQKPTRADYDILNNLHTVINAQRGLWTLSNITNESYIYIITMLLMILVVVSDLIDRKKKVSLVFVPLLLVLFLINYASNFVMAIVAEPWISQRTITGFLGMASFFLIMYIEIIYSFNMSVMSKGAIYIITFLTVYYIYLSNFVAINLIKTNTVDLYIARCVQNEIEKYEVETNQTVSKIAFLHDKYITYSYPDIVASYDLNVRSWAYDWSIKGMLYVISGRVYEVVEPSEDLVELYEGYNWDYFNSEQIIIERDTANIVLY